MAFLEGAEYALKDARIAELEAQLAGRDAMIDQLQAKLGVVVE